MSSKPFLGAARRAGPRSSPQGGTVSPPAGSGDPMARVIAETELDRIMRKLNVPESVQKQLGREARRSENRQQTSDMRNTLRRIRSEARRNAGALRALARIARFAAARHPVNVGMNAIEMLRRGMPGAGVPYGDGTTTGRELGGVCGWALDFDGCTNRQPSGGTGCFDGQGGGAFGIPCNPNIALNPADNYVEMGRYNRIPGVLVSYATVAFFQGNASSVAVPADQVLPQIPAAGRGPWMRQPAPGGSENAAPGSDAANGGVGMGEPAPRWPALNPAGQPITGPSPLPLPIPLRRLNLRAKLARVLDPVGMSESGNRAPDRDAGDLEVPARAGETIQIKPNGPPTRIPPEHKFAPPGRRTKEIKSGGFRVLLGAINTVTEGKDFLDAIYEGVDEACKKKHERAIKRRTGYSFMRPQDKAQVLYVCAGAGGGLDMCKAAKALVENQVEDFVFGKTGQKLGELANRFGPRKVRIGFQAGGSLGKTPKGAIQTDKNNQNKKPWDKWTDLLVKCG